MTIATLIRTPVIIACQPRNANSLRAFVNVQLPSGMILHDVRIHVRAASAWAMPSSKARLDRDRNVMRDGAGKPQWDDQVTFVDKETRHRFSDSIVEAVRLAFPDMLDTAL
jgi:DNA-binding cell septation regulator SpoVG